ncbi:Short-chain dehydrogenase/reductase family protein [Mycena venus]|uniref:Short-chain dehydrogenase/reductase family protein n=1 Tax=Mycena venus TaxID=2733690 RepID=A0A8H6YLU2_9AGAR|nr:Short-chain dehydrogenase/reductase family protein [Mycena venus]
MASIIRSILVTGSNQGLGMHTVHQLGSTENTLVFMGSRKLAAAEEALATFASDIHPSSTVVPVQLDITDAKSIKNAHTFIEETLKEKNLSGLDVLINNAARGGPGPFEETFAVNVIGTAAITETIRPLLNNGGAILNISSTLGSLHWHTQRPPPPLFPAYSSSKSALSSLTLQWAIQEEQKGSGIRVVSICPGHNATRMTNYTAAMSPAEGCKVIVRTALEKGGKSGVFFDKDGEVKW